MKDKGPIRPVAVHLPVDLAFPALEPELPSGWASEFAIDREKGDS
jgi:hypothetical protein